MISLSLICKAKEFYEDLGYVSVDVPHIISKEYSDFTRPEGVRDLYHADGLVYCASSEQSFAQMIDKGSLDTGEYQSLAPCFRPENKLDDNTCLIFLKTELISAGGRVPPSTMANHALSVFLKLGLRKVHVIETDIGLDIVTPGGLELGSYGSRVTPKGVAYTYGTGVAFPRFYNAILEERSYE